MPTLDHINHNICIHIWKQYFAMVLEELKTTRRFNRWRKCYTLQDKINELSNLVINKLYRSETDRHTIFLFGSDKTDAIVGLQNKLKFNANISITRFSNSLEHIIYVRDHITSSIVFIKCYLNEKIRLMQVSPQNINEEALFFYGTTGCSK